MSGASWGGRSSIGTYFSKGSLDASLAANLPATPVSGDFYDITVAGSFEDDASVIPASAYFDVTDAVRWNGTNWIKADSGSNVSDATFGVGWDADAINAPSKNAVYDEMILKMDKSADLSDLNNTGTARTNLGLGNVDNTSDANKPVSTAQQTALNLKAPLAAPAFTGDATFDTTTLVVDSVNNRVGIGTASPAVALDVVGVIHASTGIQFGSNAVGGSVTGVTLDDYEEGTWTPSLGGTATYTIQQGSYTKIGNKITAWFDIAVTTLGTGSSAYVYGLPFTSTGTGPAGTAGIVGYFSGIATSIVSIHPRVDPSTSIITIESLTASGTSITLNPLFADSARITGTITYRVA